MLKNKQNYKFWNNNWLNVTLWFQSFNKTWNKTRRSIRMKSTSSIRSIRTLESPSEIFKKLFRIPSRNTILKTMKCKLLHIKIKLWKLSMQLWPMSFNCWPRIWSSSKWERTHIERVMRSYRLSSSRRIKLLKISSVFNRHWQIRTKTKVRRSNFHTPWSKRHFKKYKSKRHKI